MAKAPSSFGLQARNPDKNIRLGDGDAVFASVGGPAYVMDLDQGRRNGTYTEVCDFIRLVQSLDILHQEGGGGFEAMDLPASSRHLDLQDLTRGRIDRDNLSGLSSNWYRDHEHLSSHSRRC